MSQSSTATGLVETWTIPESIVTLGFDFAERIERAADGTVFIKVETDTSASPTAT